MRKTHGDDFRSFFKNFQEEQKANFPNLTRMPLRYLPMNVDHFKRKQSDLALE